MKKNNNKKGISTAKVAAIGAGVAALAAATYYFFGPEGKKNRNSAKGWMIKMKGEIVDKMEDAKEMTEGLYNKIVDGVAEKYLKGGKATSDEVRSFVNMLKSQWKGISKAKPSKTTSKKVAKKAAKKSTSKSPQAK